MNSSAKSSRATSAPTEQPPFPTGQRRVVICGSMKCYNLMCELRELLYARGVSALTPEEESDLHTSLSAAQFEEFKRRVSFAYLKKIRDPRTMAILAVNPERHGIPNYLGANTFAEIAVAFAQSKRVFLYCAIPENYQDEL